MNAEFHQRMQENLDQHDAMAAALRAPSTHFDNVVAGLRDVAREVSEANEANRRAIDAMIAANRAALALLNRLESM